MSDSLLPLSNWREAAVCYAQRERRAIFEQGPFGPQCVQEWLASGDLDGAARAFEEGAVPLEVRKQVPERDEEGGITWVMRNLDFASEITQWCGQAHDRDYLVLLGGEGAGKSRCLGVITLRCLEQLVISAGNSADNPLPTNAGAETAPLPWLPVRVTGHELARALPPRKRYSPRKSGRLLVEALEKVVADRLRRGDVAENMVLAVCCMLRAWFQARRVVVLVDDACEGTPAQWKRLRTVLVPWGQKSRSLIVSTRPESIIPEMFPRAKTWELLPLETVCGVEGFIQRWFGTDEERAGQLISHLREQPRHLQLARSPGFAALLCWLWARGVRPLATAGRSLLLEQSLHELLRELWPPEQDKSLPVNSGDGAKAVLHALGRLASETFRGRRWAFSLHDLQQALMEIPELDSHGGASAVVETLTGARGLFTSEGKQLVARQAFLGELLCARHVAQHWGNNSDIFRTWLTKHGGLRLLAPGWAGMWCHLSALVPDAGPLLSALWEMHARKWDAAGDGSTLSDDARNSALQLAGRCLAAASTGAPTNLGKNIIDALLEHWRRRGNYGAILAEIQETTDLLPRLIPDLTGERWFDVSLLLEQMGPPAVPSLEVVLRSSAEDPGLAGGILSTFGKLGLATVPLLTRALRRSDAASAAIAATVLGAMGPAAAAALPELLRLLDEPGDVAPEVVTAVGQVGAGQPNVAAALLRSSLLPQRYSSPIDALAALGPAAVPEILRVLEDFPFLEDDQCRRIWNVSVEALRRLGAEQDLLAHLVQDLRADDPRRRERAATTLGWLPTGSGEDLSALLQAAQDPVSQVRKAAIKALSYCLSEPSAVLPVLIHALKHEIADVRIAAAEAFSCWCCTVSWQWRDLQTTETDEAVQFATVSAEVEAERNRTRLALGSLLLALPEVTGALRDEEATVRRVVAVALTHLEALAGLAAPELLQACQDQDAEVRQTAAMALVQMGPTALFHVLKTQGFPENQSSLDWPVADALQRLGPALVGELAQRLPNNPTPQDWEELAYVLPKAGAAAVGALPWLARGLQHADPSIRQSAAQLAGVVGPAAISLKPLLVRALDDKSAWVRAEAARALGKLKPADVTLCEPLVRHLHESFYGVRLAVVEALESLGPTAALPLARAVQDEDRRVRSAAVAALHRLGNLSEEVQAELKRGYGHESNEVRRVVTAALMGRSRLIRAEPRRPGPLPDLIQKLHHSEPAIRVEALQALADLRRAAGPLVPELARLLEDQDEGVRALAAYRLRDVGPAAALALPQLRRALRDRYTGVRHDATEVLRQLGSASLPALPEIIATLSEHQEDWDYSYRLDLAGGLLSRLSRKQLEARRLCLHGYLAAAERKDLYGRAEQLVKKLALQHDAIIFADGRLRSGREVSSPLASRAKADAL